MNTTPYRLLAIVMALLVAVSMVQGANANTMPKPPGAQLVMKTECRIDFEESVYWTGNVEDSIRQIVWLVKQLPERCLEHKCVFTNIDQRSFIRLIHTKWLEQWRDNPKLWEIGVTVTNQMKDCLIAQNTPQSLLRGGSGVICRTGNTFTLRTDGNGNRVSADQDGCNRAEITIDGNNAYLRIRQKGKNDAYLRLDGDGISVDLYQRGQNTYRGHFTSGQSAYIVQNNH